MALAAFFQFCISAEKNIDGDRYYYDIDENNHITVIIIGTIFEPCAGGGAIWGFTDFYSLGQLSEGNYTAQMYLVGPGNSFPPPPGMFGLPLGNLVSFRVNGLPAVIPVTNYFSLIFLGIIILFLSFKKFKNASSKVMVYSCFLLLSNNAIAKTFHILLSAEVGTPTPEEVVAQANTSPSPPFFLLSSFNSNPPDGVGFLLRDRPEGNLLNLVTQSPNWSLAKLYRYLVVTYPDTVDENMVLNSFNTDTDIIHAGFTGDIEVVSSTKSQTPKNKVNLQNQQTDIRGSNTDFITDLNINSAWQLSEGMGYIGAVDNGIQTDHPALAPFDSNGNYTGGNMLERFYAIDFEGGDLNIDENQPINTGGNTELEPCDLADGVDDNLATTIFVGHGTHVSGILAGKSATFNGICKNCGLSMMKNANNSRCLDFLNPPQLFPISSHSSSIGRFQGSCRLF